MIIGCRELPTEHLIFLIVVPQNAAEEHERSEYRCFISLGILNIFIHNCFALLELRQDVGRIIAVFGVQIKKWGNCIKFQTYHCATNLLLGSKSNFVHIFYVHVARFVTELCVFQRAIQDYLQNLPKL